MFRSPGRQLTIKLKANFQQNPLLFYQIHHGHMLYFSMLDPTTKNTIHSLFIHYSFYHLLSFTRHNTVISLIARGNKILSHWFGTDLITF